MSTRYLRKVYGNNLPVDNHQDDLSDNDVSITENKKKNFNVFDLVGIQFIYIINIYLILL